MDRFQDIDFEEDEPNINYTWGGISIYITHKIRRFLKDIRGESKESFIPTTSSIIESIQIMFHASGTIDKECLILKQNDELQKDYNLILHWVGHLLLATKLASSVWPPPDANEQLRQTAYELLQAVRQFSGSASSLGIPLKQPSQSEIAQCRNVNLDSSPIAANPRFVFNLDTKMLVIVNLIANFGIQQTGDILVMNGHITNKKALDMMKDITSHVGDFLLLIDKFPMDSLFGDLTIDFKVHRLTLLNSITDLMKKAQNLHEKESCSEMLIAIQLVEKN